MTKQEKCDKNKDMKVQLKTKYKQPNIDNALESSTFQGSHQNKFDNELESSTFQGQFYVYQKQIDNTILSSYAKHDSNTKTKVLVNPLSQDELAHGWSLVLPRVNNKSRIHHFKIFLSHLPEHLWDQLHLENKNLYDKNCTSIYYNIITDKIYRYSVQRSVNDNNIRELYNNVMKRNFNSNKVKELYDNLKNENVKGWLMIRARNLLNKHMI